MIFEQDFSANYPLASEASKKEANLPEKNTHTHFMIKHIEIIVNLELPYNNKKTSQNLEPK